jgi:hypothetical protein
MTVMGCTGQKWFVKTAARTWGIFLMMDRKKQQDSATVLIPAPSTSNLRQNNFR